MQEVTSTQVAGEFRAPGESAILRLNMSGMPMEWLQWEEAATYYAKGLVGWTHGDPMLILHGGTNRKGEKSKLWIHPVIATQGKQFARKFIAPLNNKTLFRRDANLCLYCGKHFSDRQLTRDHVIPISRGGKDTWTNVVAACVRCNSHKGALTPEEANMPLLAVPYPPNPFEYALFAMSERRILADQLEFLSSGVRQEYSRKF